MYKFRFARDTRGQIDFTISAMPLHTAARAGDSIEPPSPDDREHSHVFLMQRHRELGEVAFAAAIKLPGTPESAAMHIWHQDVQQKVRTPTAARS